VTPLFTDVQGIPGSGHTQGSGHRWQDISQLRAGNELSMVGHYRNRAAVASDSAAANVSA
jgi:hypothetical protein